MSARRGSRRGDRGVVTIELAIGLLTVTILTACLAGISLLGMAQASAAEGSAQIARQLARGDELAAREAARSLPDGASVDVDRQPGGVRASVRVPVRVPLLGGVTASADAWAAFEPGIEP